ncbi:hypothetical protein [Saccharothrix sp. Mg75]|uniref:hypothetical protein n=1 Tax=Saccharothrix sp. Mg75 TaxID=3445357 RepID=UPI003EE91BBB
MFEVIRFLVGAGLAVGLVVWTWRTRDAVAGPTAVVGPLDAEHRRVHPAVWSVPLVAGAALLAGRLVHGWAHRPRPGAYVVSRAHEGPLEIEPHHYAAVFGNDLLDGDLDHVALMVLLALGVVAVTTAVPGRRLPWSR